jgi:hypothetical protein
MKTSYKFAKDHLKEISIYAKKHFVNDKPAIRQTINDSTHNICNEYDLSNKKQNMLHNYACTLHP